MLLAFVDLAVARARALLAPAFYKVEAVAVELERRGMLTAREVRELFDSTEREVEACWLDDEVKRFAIVL